MEDRERYGELLTPDIKIFRQQFRELVKLIGIHVLYRAPLTSNSNGSNWTTYAELDTNFDDPILVGIIFHNHPDQKTLKKIGWVSELQEDASIIEVDYDTPGLEVGGLFIIPSGLDSAEGKLFRIVRMSNDIIYPSSITCEVVPEYVSTFDSDTAYDYSTTDFTLLDTTSEENTRMFPGGVAAPDFESDACCFLVDEEDE